MKHSRQNEPWSQVGRFSPLEKDVILDVIFAAFHSHQDVAARQTANGLLHGADARRAVNIRTRHNHTE